MSSGRLLVMDTATRRPTLAIADSGGRVIGERQWESRHRHGERLLEELEALLDDAADSPSGLRAIVVGTGPGSFTGLRIGLATAKVLAYSLGIPVVGIPTARALALAAASGSVERSPVTVTLPAGASDRYVARFRIEGQDAHQLTDTALATGAVDDEGGLVAAVDFEPPVDVPAGARELGRKALDGLAAALAAEGARRVAAGDVDDAATLVPAYVALPRGIAQAAGEITWSPDLR